MDLNEQERWIRELRALARAGGTAGEVLGRLLEWNLNHIQIYSLLLNCFDLPAHDRRKVGAIGISDSPETYSEAEQVLQPYLDQKDRWPMGTVFLLNFPALPWIRTLAISIHEEKDRPEQVQVAWGDGTQEVVAFGALPLTHHFETEGSHRIVWTMDGGLESEIVCTVKLRPSEAEANLQGVHTLYWPLLARPT